MNFAKIVAQARKFAGMAHGNVKRKVAREPFINHPARVAAIIKATGGSDAAVAAAWLHDVLEDTSQKIGHFPSRVREIVNRLTKHEGESKIQHVLRIGRSMDREAILIKCADRVDNIKDGAWAFGAGWLFNYLKSSSELLRLARKNGIENHTVVLMLQETIHDKMEVTP